MVCARVQCNRFEVAGTVGDGAIIAGGAGRIERVEFAVMDLEGCIGSVGASGSPAEGAVEAAARIEGNSEAERLGFLRAR